MTTPGLGRLPAPDPRDRNYRLSALLPPRPRRTHRYYWSGWFGDQGSSSSCVGFAWTHWLVSGPTTQATRLWEPHARNVYWAAQVVDEWPGEEPTYEGTSVRAGAKVLQERGFISEYRWTWTADEIVRALLDVGPVVVGTNWYQGMFHPLKGLIQPSGPLAGGHAYLLEGANLDRGIVRLKNSWGREWGRGGRAWITIEDLEVLIGQDGEACLAVELRVP